VVSTFWQKPEGRDYWSLPEGITSTTRKYIYAEHRLSWSDLHRRDLTQILM
jgi:hypothetical protein